MYRDSEMVIWFSAGRGLSAFVRPLFGFAWPVLVVITVLALLVWPWSNSQIEAMKETYTRRGDLERVAPGEFQESASGRRVFFLDKDTPDNKSGKNIFISSIDHGKETVTSARSGQVETIGDEQYLLLSNGQRLEQSLKGNDGIRISEFELHGTRVTNNALTGLEEGPSKTRSTLTLLKQPTRTNQGELAWRLGLAFAAVNFVLLAVTVSSVNPRVGRSGNLLFALFAFVVYYNLLNFSQSWIAGGRTGFFGLFVLLHGGTFLAATLWLAKQHNNWGLAPLMRRLRRNKTA
jgi:lipopolysaccharide export system permease protein